MADKTQYLITDKDGKGQLPYTDSTGKSSSRLMRALWAALHEGFRGMKYDGPDKTAAIAKLKSVYKEERLETLSEKMAGVKDRLLAFCGYGTAKKTIFVPITKAYEGTGDDSGFLFVEGILAAEEVDFENEIMDYASSKPKFQAWNRTFVENTGGKSVGNLRGQHNSKIVAGTFVEMKYDDKSMTIPVVAKVIDPVEQDKVREGAYTSFSIGAHYAKKWRDGKNMRWTADPFEGSLVDYGAIPATRGFSYRSADGKEEERQFDGGRRSLRQAFENMGTTLTVTEEDRVAKAISDLAAAKKGLYGVSSFAQLLQSLIYLRDALLFERDQEGDDSPVTDRVSEATDELLECLSAYTQEQVSEEIGRNAKEGAMELTDVLDAMKDRGVGPGAVSTDQEPNVAIKAAQDALKAATENFNKATEALGKLAPEACKAAKVEECTDANCKTHAAEKAAKAAKPNDDDADDKACSMPAADCKNDKCKTHGNKAAAAATVSTDALKRADVETLIDQKFKALSDVLCDRIVKAVDEKFNSAIKTVGDQLDVVGEAIKAFDGALTPSKVAVKAISKDEDGARQVAESNAKTVSDLVKSGKTVEAVRNIRERPNFVTTR